MNESWVIGFVCGLVAVAVLFRLVARKILQIDGAEKTKYDERQMIERGKGHVCNIASAAGMIPTHVWQRMPQANGPL